jgi:putative transposase
MHFELYCKFSIHGIKWASNIYSGQEGAKMDNLARRKQLRARGYDYSQAGFYFVTLCTQDRINLFGNPVGADSISARDRFSAHDSISAQPVMVLNNAGDMIQRIYCNMQNECKNIVLHEHVIMPNHFHGIIEISGVVMESRAGMESAPTGLPGFVQSFKRHTTIEYIRGVKENRFQPFNKRVWQRGYHDHIIRNEQELETIREYIINNPTKWKTDKYYT